MSWLRAVLLGASVLGGACVPPSDVPGEEQALTGSAVGVGPEAAANDQDCTLHSEPAFDQGRAFPLDVFFIGRKPVAVSTGNAFLAMQKAAKKAGVSVTLTSGFRTNAEQERLFACFQAGQCPLAAPPGTSNHQNGRALDLSVSGWLAENAGRFGFRRTVPSEPWHYEFFGDPPAGPCSLRGAEPLPEPAARGDGSTEEGAPPSELDPTIFGDARDRENCTTDRDCQPPDEDLGFRCIKKRCV